MCIAGPFSEEPSGVGKEDGGLYLLPYSKLEPKSFIKKNVVPLASNSFSRCNSVLISFSANSDSNVRLWHIRLGHLPFQAMEYISSISVVPISNCSCDIRPLARQSKLPFFSSNIKTKGVFDLIHIDTWGSYKTPTYNGYKYFLTIVDDFSRATWTYLLSTKSNAFSVLKCF